MLIWKQINLFFFFWECLYILSKASCSTKNMRTMMATPLIVPSIRYMHFLHTSLSFLSFHCQADFDFLHAEKQNFLSCIWNKVPKHQKAQELKSSLLCLSFWKPCANHIDFVLIRELNELEVVNCHLKESKFPYNSYKALIVGASHSERTWLTY